MGRPCSRRGFFARLLAAMVGLVGYAGHRRARPGTAPIATAGDPTPSADAFADGSGHCVTYTYDSSNRLLASGGPHTTVTTYCYDPATGTVRRVEPPAAGA